MKYSGFALLILIVTGGLAFGQPAQVDLLLTVTSGSAVRTLHFGLSPAAGEGQDVLMGELELPPAPPAGAFDVRFTTRHLGSDLQGLWNDYRAGTPQSSGATLYRLRFQPADGAQEIAFSYDLPAGVTGRLADRMGGIVVSHPMRGKGTCIVSQPAIAELDMEIVWKDGAAGNREEMPAVFGLLPSYPNPFNPSTTVQYSLAATGPVSLRVFDVTGREVAVLDEGIRQAGRHAIVWDASGIAGGVYFTRLTANEQTETRSMLLLK